MSPLFTSDYQQGGYAPSRPTPPSVHGWVVQNIGDWPVFGGLHKLVGLPKNADPVLLGFFNSVADTNAAIDRWYELIELRERVS